MSNYKNNGEQFRALPEYIRRQIRFAPKAGACVHQWIFRAVCVLRENYQEPLVFLLFREGVSQSGRIHSEGEPLDGWYFAKGKSELELKAFVEHESGWVPTPQPGIRFRLLNSQAGIVDDGFVQTIEFLTLDTEGYTNE